MIALAAVFCCVALAQMSAFCCDCNDGKGCGCNKPPKKTTEVEEGKGCGCNKPPKAPEVKK